MGVNLGEANIKLDLDWGTFEKVLTNVFSKLDGLKTSFGSVETNSKRATAGVTALGNSGLQAITKMMQFQTVTMVVQQLGNTFNVLKSKITSFTDAAADSELVAEKLRGGLTNLGNITSFDKLKKQAEDLSKITPFDDEDIMNMQSLLTTFKLSGEGIEKLTPVMLNLASAFARAGDTGMGLQQVAMMVGKAAGAELITAMSRVGVIFTDVQKKQLETAKGMDRINILLEVMSANSSITAEAFGNTLAGSMKITETAIGNVTESIGEALSPVVKAINIGIQNLAEIFQSLPPIVRGAIGITIAFTTALTGLIGAIAIFNIETGGILLLIGTLVTAFAGLGIIIGTNIDTFKNLISENENLTDVLNVLNDATNSISDMFRDFASSIKEQLITKIEELITSLNNLIIEFANAYGGAENLKSMLELLARETFDALFKIVIATVDAIGKIAIAMGDAVVSGENFNSSLDETNTSLGKIATTISDVGNAIATTIHYVSELITWFMQLGKIAEGVADVYMFINSMGTLGDWKGFSKTWDAIKDFKGISPYVAPQKLGPTSNNYGFGNEGELLFDPNQFAKGENNILTGNTDGTGDNKSGDKGKNKDKDPKKIELDLLKDKIKAQDELLNQVEHEIKMGRALNINKLEQLEKTKLVLEALSNVVVYEENREEISKALRKNEDDILNYYKEQGKAITENMSKELKKFNEFRKQEKERAKLQKQFEFELKEIQLTNANDEYGLEMLQIEKKYETLRQKIEELYINEEQKKIALAELERQKLEETKKVMTEEGQFVHDLFSGLFSNLVSFVSGQFNSMWKNVFGEANSLFEKFFEYVSQKLFELAMSDIFTSILNIFSGGIGGSIFGFIGSIFGGGGAAASVASAALPFGTGGYTGDGNPNDPAGIVHKKEFVLNERATAKNRAIAELMNKGFDVGAMLSQVSNMPSIPSVSGSSGKFGKNLSVNVGGINVKLENKSLKGLSYADYCDWIDKELGPQLAYHLKRTGRDVFDSSIVD